VPTDAEWITLTTFLGGEAVAGGKLKETGTTHWITPNTGATNESGFTGLAGGYHLGVGSSFFIGNYGFWWSSTEYSSTNAWVWGMSFDNISVIVDNIDKRYGGSVRCVRDF